LHLAAAAAPLLLLSLHLPAPWPLMVLCFALAALYCYLQNPVGVAIGATAGHALATAIAVAGGALAGKYVSERTVNLISGVLFLLFAAATVYTML
jgi:putative Ca2+/H+ antiporter (TMEM165/GDT1 family)